MDYKLKSSVPLCSGPKVAEKSPKVAESYRVHSELRTNCHSSQTTSSTQVKRPNLYSVQDSRFLKLQVSALLMTDATYSSSSKPKPSSLASLPAPSQSRSSSPTRGSGTASTSSSGQSRPNVGEDSKSSKAGGGADDTAARIGALEAQIANLTRLVELKAVFKELPPTDGGSTAASAASAGAASVGDKKSAGLVAKLDEASKNVPTSAGLAAAAARRVPKGPTAAAPSRVTVPADDKGVDDDEEWSADDCAGKGAGQSVAATGKLKRLGGSILEAAHLHGSFRAWCRNVEWKSARNKHEALSTSMALDSFLADGVSPQLDGMEMLMRRLAALQLADATKQYGVTETMSFVPFGGTSLLPADDMERELAKAIRMQKVMQPTVASVFANGRGGGGGGRGAPGRGGRGGGWKRGGGVVGARPRSMSG